MQNGNNICKQILAKYTGSIHLLEGECLLSGIARICPADYELYKEVEQELMWNVEDLEDESPKMPDKQALQETANSYLNEMTEEELSSFIHERNAANKRKWDAEKVASLLAIMEFQSIAGSKA
jgi:hypothetical protein